MPYKSDAQRRYFNANRAKLEAEGVDVDEWNESSKGKKLPERAKEANAVSLSELSRRAAQLGTILKQAETEKEKSKKKPAAKELVNMDSTGGRLADYLATGMWGGERAGRTQAMADAIGEKTTFGVRHPFSQALLHAMAGAGAGAGLGALAESLATDGLPSGLGGLIGGGVGLTAGNYLAGKSRRDEMRRIGHFYDQDAAEGKVNAKNPKLSLLSALLLPGRGPHRSGQVEAVRAMQGGKSVADQRGSRDMHYGMRMAPYGGGVLGLIHNYAQNIKTQRAVNQPSLHEPEFKRNPKVAGDIARLARAAVKQARCWEGYEPVPGKKPYSEDSCRPAGSGETKKKEKKAGLLLRDLPDPDVLSLPTGPNNEMRAFATKYREPRLLAKPFYTNDRKAVQQALILTAAMDPSILDRELGNTASPFTADDADYIGLNLRMLHPNRFKGSPELEQALAATEEKKAESIFQTLARLVVEKQAASGAWTRAEGQSESGGLNAKGRASLKAQGHDIKPPVTESKPTGERAGRKARFCARMGGMKKKLTSSETANDPDSRINKSLRKWNC